MNDAARDPDAAGDLTVIVPTWNQKVLLKACLTALRRQTVVPGVLVVDNGSNDGTEEMVRTDFPEVEYIRSHTNLGFAKAVNIGLGHLKTPLVALLNNDTEPDPGWAEAGTAAFRSHPQFSFLASRMIRYFERERLDSAGDCYSRGGLPYKRGAGAPIDHYPEREPVLGASAGAAFYRRSLFESIGCLDEEFFMYLEDVELSLRAQITGHRCLYVPEAVVYHIEAASDPSRAHAGLEPVSIAGVYYSDRRVFWITRNRWLLMIMYQPARHLPWILVAWVKSLLFHLLKAGHTMAFLKGVGAGLAKSPGAIKKRASMNRKRILGAGELCQILRRC